MPNLINLSEGVKIRYVLSFTAAAFSIHESVAFKYFTMKGHEFLVSLIDFRLPSEILRFKLFR